MIILNKTLLLLAFLVMIIGTQQAKASHLYASEISYRCIGGNQYIVQLETFQDCAGVAPATQLSINYQSTSCAVNSNYSLPQLSFSDVTPFCAFGTSPCVLGSYGTYRVVYADTITLMPCSDWVLSYSNCCRSSALVNLNSPSTTSIYSYVDLDNSVVCNNSAIFTNMGNVYACANQPFQYDPSVYDIDGDSLVWALVPAKQTAAMNVTYNVMFTGANPFGAPVWFDTIGILHVTPIMTGAFLVAFQVKEYRNGVLIATSYKDLTLVVYNCTNNAPIDTIVNIQGAYLEDNIFYVYDPSQFTFDIVGTDADAGDTLTFSSDIASIGGSFVTTGVNPATASFTWPVSLPMLQEFMVHLGDNNCTVNGAKDFGFAIVYVGPCVWAGDTDTNQVVNNFDLLPIGLGFGETGPLRANADLFFDCEPAADFVNSTPITNINYKHSDTDGNGTVNADDTLAITLNWGQFYLKNSSSSPATAIPFYMEYTTALEGETVQIPIILGDTSVLADSIYGVAFTINYDETMTEPNSVFADFNMSWLGTINSDMISVQKDFYAQGELQVAIVRTDQTNRDGMGQIGTLTLTIKDDILKKSTTQRLDLSISNVRIITNTETERSANTPPTDILVTLLSSTIDLTNKATEIKVFPNPAKTILNIQSNDLIQEVVLYTITGQVVLVSTQEGLTSSINVQNLENGIYMLKVQTQHGFSTQKIQVIK